MEGLAGAASAISVLSLSLQLINSIKGIKTFIKNVKGAKTEVERLVEQLERLSELLEEIRQVTDFQASQFHKHLQSSSKSILKCLKSCERQLELLKSFVKRYQGLHQNSLSKKEKVWSSVKLGLRANDIAGFENRIEHEIMSLTTALSLNSMWIQYVLNN